MALFDYNQAGCMLQLGTPYPPKPPGLVHEARAPDGGKNSALRLERCVQQLQAATQQASKESSGRA